MRVLNVNVMLDPIFGGGTAERTVQMSKAFHKAGVECQILTTDLGLTESRIKELEGIEIVALHCLIKRFFIVKCSIPKLKKLIENVDIVHLMGHWNVLNVLVYLITRVTKTPYVICPAGELNIFGRSIVLKKIFNLVIGNSIIRNASGYIAVTNDERRFFNAYNIDCSKLIEIPNGVSQSDFEPDDSKSTALKATLRNQPYILFMGRLNLIKGPDLLLKAFLNIADRYPDQHLVFAGPDGGMLKELQQLTESYSLSHRVHFIGYLGGQDKVLAYKNADILVIPSRHEAMSIVVLESGMVKTPVLITDQCGFDVIAKKNGGFVVEANTQAIEDGLCEALRNKTILKKMGISLHEFVIENYTWNIIANQYLSFFETVINKKKITPLK